MKRRQVLATLAATMPALALGRSNEPSIKKGWAGGDARLHKLFGTHCGGLDQTLRSGAVLSLCNGEILQSFAELDPFTPSPE